jgi:O-antigen/teichoic acid export membrane protein
MKRKTESVLALSWQSIGYGIGQLGRGLVVYLTLPLLTRLVGPAEYGAIAVLTAFMTFTDVLSDAGLPSATFRLFHDSHDAGLQRRVLGSSLLLFFLYAVVVAAAVYYFAGNLAGWLAASARYAELFRIAALLMVLLTLVSFGEILYRIQVRPLADSLAILFMSIAQNGLALALVAFYGLGVYGYWWGQLIGAALTVLLMAITLRRSLHFSLSWEKMRGLTLFALPMIPATISMWALRLADRPIILHFYGLPEAGIYDLGYKVGSLLMLAVAPFGMAWQPFAFSHMRDQDAPLLFRDVLTGMAAVCTFMGLSIFALRRELVLLFGSVEYIEAVNVVGWVVLGQIALGLYFVLSIGPRITKRTSLIAAATIAGATVNVVLNFWLLPVLGIVGAAIATTVGYALLAVLSYLLGQREFHFPLDYGRLVKLVIVAAIGVVYVFWVESAFGTSVLSLILRALVIPLFVLMLFASKFIALDQFREAMSFVQQRLLRRGKNPTRSEA